jgi:acetyl-CoA carboxylase biotin carboxyl carrier protein
MLHIDVDQIAAWLAATDISELELRGPTSSVRLRKDSAGVVTIGDARPPAGPAGMTVTAPTVGIFLHRHPLHDTPLAPTGARVIAGQPLGLLQIGILLLPVPAPAPGIVAGMWAPHGAIVGFGTGLVELHPVAEQA